MRERGRNVIDTLTKIPPHSIEAEQAVIGACLLEPTAMPPLSPDEFYKEGHRTAWRAMRDLVDLDGGLDIVTLTSHLRTLDLLDDVGGYAHLASCMEQGCVTSQVKGLARQIREAAKQREIMRLGAEMIQSGLSEAEVVKRLNDLPGPLTGAIYDPAINWERIQARWGKKRILTGFGSLDHVLTGLGEGKLIVIAGRTSHGKTAFATNLQRILSESGHTTDYITLEDTDDDVTQRLISQVSGIATYRLTIGNLNEHEFQDAEEAVKHIQGIPLNVTALDTIRSLSEDSVVGMVSTSAAKIIFVDYLQKVSTPGPSRVYGIENFMNRLHAIAIRDGKVVVLMAQLSRTMETENRPPRLSDLRDSGSIEQIARQVLLLYWPWKADNSKPQNEYVVDVAKNSGAGTGTVTIDFEAVCGRFKDYGPSATAHAAADAILAQAQQDTFGDEPGADG